MKKKATDERGAQRRLLLRTEILRNLTTDQLKAVAGGQGLTTCNISNCNPGSCNGTNGDGDA